MASASQTTPDRQLGPDDEHGSTDAGDATTAGLPTPSLSTGSTPPAPAVESPLTSMKRKEPASAFSSASDVGGSAMSLDPPAVGKGKARSASPMEDIQELEDEARSAKRRSTNAPTPRRRSARGGTPATAPMSPVEPPSSGPTTRHRAKVARLS